MVDYAEKAREIRAGLLKSIASIGVGHVGGSLSIADVLAVLYFGIMKIDPKNPGWEERDRLVLSKGHAGPALYATLAARGYYPMEDCYTLNQPGTNFPSHCDRQKTPGVDMTTGSLGQGLSIAVGMALGLKLKNNPATVFCIVGDGESQEGQIWEAAMYAAQKKVDNLVAFTDYNKLQIDAPVAELNDIAPLAAKWTDFGWKVYEVDGHDYAALEKTIKEAQAFKGQPAMIIMHTVKGKGADFAENNINAHSMNLTMEQADDAIAKLYGEVK